MICRSNGSESHAKVDPPTFRYVISPDALTAETRGRQAYLSTTRRMPPGEVRGLRQQQCSLPGRLIDEVPGIGRITLDLLSNPRQSDLQGARIEIFGYLLLRHHAPLALGQAEPREEETREVVLLAVVDMKSDSRSASCTGSAPKRQAQSCGALNVLAGHVRESDVANLTLLAQSGQCFH